jgi:hypothetical protein
VLALSSDGFTQGNSTTIPFKKRLIPSEQLVLKLRWDDRAKSGHLPKFAELDQAEAGAIKIVRSAENPQSIPIATIERPAIRQRAYMLRGAVKYEGILGDGFLEMWNHFPEPRAVSAFTRTMDRNGPMGLIQGDSPWREFQLPFIINDESFPSPEKLEVNVFLPKAGTIWISDLELIEFPISPMMSATPAVAPGNWATWSSILVTVFAGLGCAVGVLGTTLWFKRVRNKQDAELRRMQSLNIE